MQNNILNFCVISSLALIGNSLGTTNPASPQTQQRIYKLKDFLNSEKTNYQVREQKKTDALTELDNLNQKQNEVRNQITGLKYHQEELQSALQNIEQEVEKHRLAEKLQIKRLVSLLKVLYIIRKDGAMKFLLEYHDIASLAGRVRILFRSLKSHEQIAKSLNEKKIQLEASEQKLKDAKVQAARLLIELSSQQELLASFLEQKKTLVVQFNKKQTAYRLAAHEYKKLSKQFNTIFESETRTKTTWHSIRPILPLDHGRVAQSFGKHVHETFGTVTYMRGVELEAEHDAKVMAVYSGKVEFAGWVKGLGNVVIIDHGEGTYSLNAHLFRLLKKKGDELVQGDVIGTVGDTGSSDKPSLYFELREGSKPVDPMTNFDPVQLANWSVF